MASCAWTPGRALLESSGIQDILDSAVEMLALTQAVLRRWWLLLLLGAVGAACAYAATTAVPKRYQSTVSLQLNPAAKSAFLAYTSPDATASNPVTTLAASYRRSSAAARSVNW